jgi:hypothetical protein
LEIDEGSAIVEIDQQMYLVIVKEGRVIAKELITLKEAILAADNYYKFKQMLFEKQE